ncbi:MAG: NAD(P)H-hydrate dehydratase, partial [Bacteroidetes bacterium]|nr:NAD(P)H-hydrate dehydratase [Bacteroidota bacterium]
YVIDADGISAFRGRLNLLKNKKIVMTPHAGEFSSLLGISNEEIRKDFYNYAVEFAKKYNTVLVLKNSPTIITDGREFYINPTGRENLATAGTGDVLAGIVSGLISQSKNLLQSAIAGVYIHGMCGDSLFKEYGNSMIASDLIGKIADVKKSIFSYET